MTSYFVITNLTDKTAHFYAVEEETLEAAEKALEALLSPSMNFLIDPVLEVPEIAQKPPKKRRKRETLHL